MHRIGLFGRRFGEHIVAVQFVFGFERGGERVLFAAVHVFELLGAGRNKASYLRPAVTVIVKFRGVNGRHVAALVGAVVSEYLFRPLRRNLGRIYGDFERAIVNFVVGSRYLKVHGVAFNAAVRTALYVAEHNGTVAYGVIVDVVKAESPFGRVAKLPVSYRCGGHFHSACRRVLYAVVRRALFAAVDFVNNLAIGYFGGRYHIRALERSFCERNVIVGIFPIGGNIVSPCILSGAVGDKNSYIKIVFAVHFARGYAVVAILYAIVRSNDDAVVGLAALYYFHGDLRGGYDEFIRHIGGERIVAAEIVIRIELCGEYVAASVGEISVGSYCKFVLAAVDALIPCGHMAEQRFAAIYKLFRLSAPFDSNLFGRDYNNRLCACGRQVVVCIVGKAEMSHEADAAVAGYVGYAFVVGDHELSAVDAGLFCIAVKNRAVRLPGICRGVLIVEPYPLNREHQSVYFKRHSRVGNGVVLIVGRYYGDIFARVRGRFRQFILFAIVGIRGSAVVFVIGNSEIQPSHIGRGIERERVAVVTAGGTARVYRNSFGCDSVCAVPVVGRIGIGYIIVVVLIPAGYMIFPRCLICGQHIPLQHGYYCTVRIRHVEISQEVRDAVAFDEF